MTSNILVHPTGDLNRRGVPSPGAAWKRRQRASDG